MTCTCSKVHDFVNLLSFKSLHIIGAYIITAFICFQILNFFAPSSREIFEEWFYFIHLVEYIEIHMIDKNK